MVGEEAWLQLLPRGQRANGAVFCSSSPSLRGREYVPPSRRNISEKEKKMLAKMAKELMTYSQPTLNQAVKSGALIEVEVER